MITGSRYWGQTRLSRTRRGQDLWHRDGLETRAGSDAHSHFEQGFERQRALPVRIRTILRAWVGAMVKVADATNVAPLDASTLDASDGNAITCEWLRASEAVLFPQ